jgi:hypothetical protein
LVEKVKTEAGVAVETLVRKEAIRAVDVDCPSGIPILASALKSIPVPIPATGVPEAI